jgi:hypothetical protein
MLIWLQRKIALKILNNLIEDTIRNMPKNWKTSLLGILAIVATIAHVGTALLNGQPLDMATLTMLIAGFSGGLGLIHATDATKNVTP